MLRSFSAVEFFSAGSGSDSLAFAESPGLEGEWHLLLLFLLINFVGNPVREDSGLLSVDFVAGYSHRVGFVFCFRARVYLVGYFRSPAGFSSTAGFAGLLAAVCLIWHPMGAGKLVDTVTHGRTVWEGIGGISSERLSGLVPLILIASCSLALAGGVIIYFARQEQISGDCRQLCGLDDCSFSCE